MLTVTDIAEAAAQRSAIDAQWINDRVNEINNMRGTAVYNYRIDPAGNYPVNLLISGLVAKGYQARITNGMLTITVPPLAPTPAT